MRDPFSDLRKNKGVVIPLEYHQCEIEKIATKTIYQPPVIHYCLAPYLARHIPREDYDIQWFRSTRVLTTDNLSLGRGMIPLILGWTSLIFIDDGRSNITGFLEEHSAGQWIPSRDGQRFGMFVHFEKIEDAMMTKMKFGCEMRESKRALTMEGVD